jgi:hypothetical protein
MKGSTKGIIIGSVVLIGGFITYKLVFPNGKFKIGSKGNSVSTLQTVSTKPTSDRLNSRGKLPINPNTGTAQPSA